MPKGFLNPDNAAKSTDSRFKEGYVKVLGSVFRVHQGRSGEGQPERAAITALVWNIARLNEDLEPLTNEDGEEIREELVFSLGGKSLPAVHPGVADSPDDNDEDVEDAGDEVNAEGPTIKLINSSFKPHEKSSVMKLFNSLKLAGYKQEYLDRVWAPDFVGMIAFMATEVDEDMKQKYTNKEGKEIERGTAYKIVKKMAVAPYEKKAKAGKAVSSDEAKPSKNADAEAALKPILEKISSDRDGSEMTRKAFNSLVTSTLQSQKVNVKLHVPALSLIKDDKWAAKNLPKYDITLSEDGASVTIGTPATDEDEEAA